MAGRPALLLISPAAVAIATTLERTRGCCPTATPQGGGKGHGSQTDLDDGRAGVRADVHGLPGLVPTPLPLPDGLSALHPLLLDAGLRPAAGPGGDVEPTTGP